MKTNLTTRSMTLALAALTSLAHAQTPAYEVTDLGAVNGESEAFAINNHDQVVGWSFLLNGTRGAMLWENGRKTILSSVGGTSVAFAINDDRVIVGKRGTRAVQFTATNQFRDLGTFGGPEGVGFGLNDIGQIAGAAQTPDGRWRGFASRYDTRTGLIDLGTLGGLWSFAKDVNNVGAFCGWAHTGGPARAAIFVPRQRPQDLGTLGGPQSEAHAINDYFAVTGWSDRADRHNTPTNKGNMKHAFMWSPENGRQDLGDPYSAGKTKQRDSVGRTFFQMTLREGEVSRTVNVYGVDTFGYGINKGRTVCGNARLYLGPNPRQVDRATVWLNGKMYDLNDLNMNNPFEWSLDHAWGINDNGVIVGRGFNYRVGQFRAFMARRVR